MSTTATPTTQVRISQLDGLRGMAILAVLLYHYVALANDGGSGWFAHVAASLRDAFAIGWAGVDLFFLLSGFLIGGILLDARGSPTYFRTFYARRFFRIIPLYYLWLGLFFLLSPAFIAWLRVAPAAAEKWTSLPVYLLFLQNWTRDLHGLVGTAWLGHLWSLAVEEQFYLVMPLAVWLLSRRQLVQLLCATICAAPLLRFAVFQASSSHRVQYMLTPCRADALAMGVLLAVAWREPRWKEIVLRNKGIAAGLLASLLAASLYFAVFRSSPYSLAMAMGGFSILDACCAGLVGLALLAPQGRWASICRWRFLVAMGRISYCLYVIHQAVNLLCHEAILRQAPRWDSWASAAVTLLAGLLSCGIALLSWKFLESPLLRRGHAFKYLPAQLDSTPAATGPRGQFGGVMKRAAWLIAAAALLLRIFLVVWAGNAPETALTGGSDAPAYQTLADNIVHHRGMSYAGEPTALRAPAYPFLLAAAQVAVGRDYRILVRWIQLLSGLLMGLLCAIAAKKLGGSPEVAFAAALAAPTLIFFSAELLTETLAALVVAAFFWAVLSDANPLWVGALIGLGMLERFNLVVLAPVYAVYQFTAYHAAPAAKRTALAGLVALVLIAPWCVRNLRVFQGQVLYSTQGGMNLLQGVLTPYGRTQTGETRRLKDAAGWLIEGVETNTPHRYLFGSEPELDRKASRAALAEMKNVNLASLALGKLAHFWLSLDQLFEAEGLSRRNYMLRLAGVAAYWLLLALALRAWLKLRKRPANTATLFPAYAVIVTLLHLPYVMNTRIRAPLVEPMLAILAGLAFAMPSGPIEAENPLVESENEALCRPSEDSSSPVPETITTVS